MTTSSKLFTSRIVVSGGGGGLMLDLTPDFCVTLEKKKSKRSHKIYMSTKKRTKPQDYPDLYRSRIFHAFQQHRTTAELL